MSVSFEDDTINRVNLTIPEKPRAWASCGAGSQESYALAEMSSLREKLR